MLIGELYLNGSAVAYPDRRISVSMALSRGLVHDFDDTIGNPEVPVFDVDCDGAVADLAVDALRETLTSTGADASDVGLLLHCGWWHQGFDMWSAAHYVAHQTGAVAALPVNISQGCNAPMAAVELVSRSMLSDRKITAAAVTTSDAMQAPQLDRWNLNYGCVHGDAGTAALVSREAADGNSFRILSIASSAAPELEEMNRSGHVPTPGPAMRQGGLLDLKSAKKAYLTEFGLEHFTRLARESLTGCVREALDDAGLSGAEDRIRAVAVPRLSRKIFDTVYRPQLAPFFGDDKLLWHGGRTAHLGVADVGANIADVYKEQNLRPDDVVVIVNAGGGYTWSCLVLEMTPWTS
jgi:3-oxoacyl-[acyl-carrier-protein] synthase-3